MVASHIGTNVGLAFLMPPALSLVGSISSASVQSRVSYWCGEMFKRDVELSNSPEFFRENSTLYFNFFFLSLTVQATVSKHAEFGDIFRGFYVV